MAAVSRGDPVASRRRPRASVGQGASERHPGDRCPGEVSRQSPPEACGGARDPDRDDGIATFWYIKVLIVMLLEAEVLQALARSPIEKRAITNLRCLNEAYAYAKPSSFSRGMRIDLEGVTILLISGTASIDERGRSVHICDFRAQCRRTFWNITQLLESEGATWK